MTSIASASCRFRWLRKLVDGIVAHESKGMEVVHDRVGLRTPLYVRQASVPEPRHPLRGEEATVGELLGQRLLDACGNEIGTHPVTHLDASVVHVVGRVP